MKKSFLLTIFILVATAVPSFALPISISGSNGLNGLGSFSGKFEYDPTNFSITVSLTNTSPAANGGYLTAFAFNIPDSFTVTGITFVATGYEFSELTSPVKAPPYGSFDTGAGLSSDNWAGAGDPKVGIPVDATGSFTFELAGKGLEFLTTADFFSQPDPWFVARFMGFKDKGSDKVPNDPNTPTPVPEPATMLLLGAGLIGLGLFGRKKSLK